MSSLVSSSSLTASEDIRLLALQDENRFCADCGQEEVTLVDLTYHVFLCLPCANIHHDLHFLVEPLTSNTFTDNDLLGLLSEAKEKRATHSHPLSSAARQALIQEKYSREITNPRSDNGNSAFTTKANDGGGGKGGPPPKPPKPSRGLAKLDKPDKPPKKESSSIFKRIFSKHRSRSSSPAPSPPTVAPVVSPAPISLLPPPAPLSTPPAYNPHYVRTESDYSLIDEEPREDARFASLLITQQREDLVGVEDLGMEESKKVLTVEPKAVVVEKAQDSKPPPPPSRDILCDHVVVHPDAIDAAGGWLDVSVLPPVIADRLRALDLTSLRDLLNAEEAVVDIVCEDLSEALLADTLRAVVKNIQECAGLYPSLPEMPVIQSIAPLPVEITEAVQNVDAEKDFVIIHAPPAAPVAPSTKDSKCLGLFMEDAEDDEERELALLQASMMTPDLEPACTLTKEGKDLQMFAVDSDSLPEAQARQLSVAEEIDSFTDVDDGLLADVRSSLPPSQAFALSELAAFFSESSASSFSPAPATYVSTAVQPVGGSH
eukprot:gene3206-3511_t